MDATIPRDLSSDTRSLEPELGIGKARMARKNPQTNSRHLDAVEPDIHLPSNKPFIHALDIVPARRPVEDPTEFVLQTLAEIASHQTARIPLCGDKGGNLRRDGVSGRVHERHIRCMGSDLQA